MNTNAITAIYARAAAITAGATTTDLTWWSDVEEETKFLLHEALGLLERPEGCDLPTLEDLEGNPNRLAFYAGHMALGEDPSPGQWSAGGVFTAPDGSRWVQDPDDVIEDGGGVYHLMPLEGDH